MGSWSVYCGISNITITSGNDCVLLPLKETNGECYKYSPASLPIFGKYNDYGGIEEIVIDDNTKLIEEHLCITIDEFCEFLLNGKFTYDRSKASAIALKLEDDVNSKFDEVANMRFMWIDRKVYDFMLENLDEYSKGNLEYGTPEMLNLLGFTFLERREDFTNYDPKRYNQKWKREDFEVYSDGTSLLTLENKYIYHFGKGDEYSIETYFDVPDELHYLKTKSVSELWRLQDVKKQRKIGSIFGDYSSFDMDFILEGLRGFKKEPKTLYDKYMNDMNTFGDRIVELQNIKSNLYPMSSQFLPSELYITPQCGEHRKHQNILDKFSEINRSYIDYDNEDYY
jgi:hypothetical protein